MLRKLFRWENVMRAAVAAVESTSNVFCTFHGRPRRAADVVPDFETSADSGRDVAIVLQGPVIADDGFTYETVLLYKKLFPAAALVISTWRGLAPEARRRFEVVGATVIENDDPAWPGVSNINRQIVSSSAGVREAVRIGTTYTLKTRTDQRIYSPRALEILRGPLRAFPLSPDSSRQRMRIVGCSLNSFRYRMYGLSDMLTFGCTSDMATYWAPELDERRISPEVLKNESRTLRGFARLRLGEVFLAARFLEATGYRLAWTLADSWKAFGSRFAVVNASSLDLFWLKYVRQEIRWRGYDEIDRRSREIQFEDWLQMRCESPELVTPEWVLDLEAC